MKAKPEQRPSPRASMGAAMNTRTHPPQSASERRGLERVAVPVSRVPVAVIGVVSGVAIAVLVVLGILQRAGYPLLEGTNLDAEVSMATWFSAALLWTAAGCWLLVAVTARPRTAAVWIWWPVLAWLALDEGLALHERLERWSGIDWQVLYLPVIGLAAAAWWGVVRRQWTQRPTVVLLVTAAVAWATALLLEVIQNWGGSPVAAVVYDPAMVTEEALEMVGSTVLLMAAILALRRSVQSESQGDAKPST